MYTSYLGPSPALHHKYCILSYLGPSPALHHKYCILLVDAEDFDIEKGFAGDEEFKDEDKDLNLDVSPTLLTGVHTLLLVMLKLQYLSIIMH